MRRALCTVAALAAMICVPQAVRAADVPAPSVDQPLPVTTAVLRDTEKGTNVQEVNWRYGYRYPYYGGYRYGYRYPSYGYRSYSYPRYYGYRYSYPSYRYGYGYPSYGYGYRYGYRPGISFGFRF